MDITAHTGADGGKYLMPNELKALITLGDPEYDAIYAIYLHQQGKVFNYAGQTWRAIKDDLIVKFSRIDSGGGLDAAYGSNSIPTTGN
jgi:hypothetical protein